jgi:hypothetical protein
MPKATQCQAASLFSSPSLGEAVFQECSRHASHALALVACECYTRPFPLPLFWPRSGVCVACGNVFSPAQPSTRDHHLPTSQGRVSPAARHGVPAPLPLGQPVRPCPVVRCACPAAHAASRRPMAPPGHSRRAGFQCAPVRLASWCVVPGPRSHMLRRRLQGDSISQGRSPKRCG